MIKIQVPGTTANIGPGFDTLGLALTCYNTLTVQETNKENIDIEGNLIYESFQYFYSKNGLTLPKVELEMTGDIPRSRGLGSSAACIIGGLLAANELSGMEVLKEDILEMATEIEGHPDNVAPALLGGLVGSVMKEGKVKTVSYPVSESIKFLLVVPDFELSTSLARSVLPKDVTYQDALFNVSRMPFLLQGLMEGNMELLKIGTEDRLHQPYRQSLIQGFKELKKYVGDRGSVLISGAGPTILILTKDELLEEELPSFLGNLGNYWEVFQYTVDSQGAKILT